MAVSKRVSMRGTEHLPMPGARAIGPISPHELIEISVILQRRQPLAVQEHRGKPINHNDFAGAYGADPGVVDKAREFAREYNLQLLETGEEVRRRTIVLAGTAANLEKAFGVELTAFEYPDGTYRSHTGPMQMPEEYAPMVVAVLGLDNRPIAHPHLRWRGANHPFATHAASVS